MASFPLSANDLNLTTFDATPAGFDPKLASDLEIERFGVPSRPDAASTDQYRDLWDNVFSSVSTFVVPTFQKRVRSTRIGTSRARRTGIQFNNWAGVGIDSGGVPLKTVSGTWTMPTLSMPASAPGDGKCFNSVWVGIDGFSPPAADILQIGIDLDATRTAGQVDLGFYPWWEWWKGDSYYFDLPTNPGNLITCTIICNVGASHGTVYIFNKTSQQHTAFSVPAPAGTTLLGNCAEWIVERQTIDASSAVLTDLCQFTDITISHAFAAASFPPQTTTPTLNAGDGTLITMVSDNGETLATSLILDPTSLKIVREQSAIS